MERARVNGFELEYELRGAGDAVLLIHGSHIAGSFVPLLAQPAMSDGYMLIRYHRRGFYDSAPATGPVSMSDQAAGAAALLDHLGVQTAHVVGHSYGGAIALQLALDAPERVHSLALLEPAVLSVPRGRVVFELIAVAKRLYDQGFWEAAEDFFLGTPRGDWYFTGDRYRETDDGVFVYEGRADDMIKIGGLWASPIAIENALIEHPGVLEVAAIGVESDYTTRVKAFVVPHDRDASAEFASELQAWCKERLRRYEYPQFIEFLEELPKTPTGKIQRYKLRSLANVTRGFA